VPCAAPRLSQLDISPGDAALDAALGGYYLRLDGTVQLVEAGFHGPLDAHGVPQSRSAGGYVYNACTISQYALALHQEQLQQPSEAGAGKLRRQLTALTMLIDEGGVFDGCIVNRWDDLKYKTLRAPWVSAMYAGNAVSALLRGYLLLGQNEWLHVAKRIVPSFAIPVQRGGAQMTDDCGHLWFEEYPLQPPTHVLNGFLFSLWGILDFARLTGDGRCWQWWHEGVGTLLAHLPEYDAGFWSVYDLRYRELSSVHYHRKIHVPQLRVMHALTGEDLFGRYARRWERFGRSLWRRSFLVAAVRAQAWLRGRRFA
jgi:hypothetical protein